MKRIYCNRADVARLLLEITRHQQKTRVFSCVTVKEYRGRKYGPETVVICVG